MASGNAQSTAAPPSSEGIQEGAAGTDGEQTLQSTPATQLPVSPQQVQPPVALFFFLGGFAVLFLVMSYELVIRPRMKVQVRRADVPAEE
jgi:hypothetical protein